MAEEAPKKEAPKKEAKKKEGSTRKPSALKRDLQGDKRRQRNRSYRASVLTSIRSLDNSLTQKEPKEAIKTKLNALYSMMDKGVKRGVYKKEKAARTKARLAARCAK